MTSPTPPTSTAPSEETTRRLLRFLCALAWADNAIQPEEARVIQGLIQRFGLTGPAFADAIGALHKKPAPDALRIDDIPPSERRRFLSEGERLVGADGRVAAQEKRILDLLREAILKG